MEDKKYPSDISRDQFETIRPLLESARKITKPRTVDLYDAFCGLLYIPKTGSQWRQLPKDYPKWRTVHEYFLIWSRKASPEHPSVLEQALKKSGQCGTVRPRRMKEQLFLSSMRKVSTIRIRRDIKVMMPAKKYRVLKDISVSIAKGSRILLKSPQPMKQTVRAHYGDLRSTK